MKGGGQAVNEIQLIKLKRDIEVIDISRRKPEQKCNPKRADPDEWNGVSTGIILSLLFWIAVLIPTI